MVLEDVIVVTVGSESVTLLQVEWNLLGPSDTAPIPASGFSLITTAVEIDGTKYWIEYRSVQS